MTFLGYIHLFFVSVKITLDLTLCLAMLSADILGKQLLTQIRPDEKLGLFFENVNFEKYQQVIKNHENLLVMIWFLTV